MSGRPSRLHRGAERAPSAPVDGERAGAARVLVSIVSHFNPVALERCLSTAEAAAEACPGEVAIAVLDNASCGESVEMVRRRFPRVQVIAQPLWRGYGANQNTTVRVGDSEYVLLLNDDVQLARDALALLTRFLDEHPRAAVVGPRVRDEAGRSVDSALALPSMWRTIRFAATLGFDASTQSDGDHPRPVGFVSGCAMLMRRSALDEVGGFDERFYMYREEVDLCARLHAAGHEVWLLPAAQVTHAEGQATAGLIDERIAEAWRSNTLYWDKHHGRLAALVEPRIRGTAYLARWIGRATLSALTGGRIAPGRLSSRELALIARNALLGPRGRGLREHAEDWNAGASQSG